MAVETRAERNIRWIEEFCIVPEGTLMGSKVVLRDWQRADMRRIYDNPHGTRLAIISFAKKNGKTSLAACLLLLHLVGPEAVPNTQLPSTAQSRDQAGVLFALAAKMVRLNPDLDTIITIRDTAKQLFCPHLGTLYKALSAEASTAHGQSPIFAVHDELGQVRGPRSELFDAIENAMGAHTSPMSIIISTQAPTDNDLLSKLIDDAIANDDPHTVVSLYTAPDDMDAFSDEALRAANPAFGDFLNADELRRRAEKAKRTPTAEANYRNYTLNQRVEARAPFVSRTVWDSCGEAPVEDWSGLPVYAGLDLSTVSDLTAFVMIAPVNGVWQVKPIFWLPEDGLVDRAKRDTVQYDVWKDQGYLRTTPGPVIDYHRVAAEVAEAFDEYDIQQIAFDPWRFEYLKQSLQRGGLSDDRLERFEPFRQGWKSMAPALDALEAAILQKKIAHGGHPVLKMCAANAVVQADKAGNRMLDKAKSTGRIDGMVALAMAVSVAGTHEEVDEGPSVYAERGALVL